MCGFFCYHGMQKEAPMELLFVIGFSQLSVTEFFVFRKMESHETKNHLLCGCVVSAYSTITFPCYNRGVQATIKEKER